MSDPDVRRVQQLYPQIYLACHREHRRSPRDAALLSHLHRDRPVSPRTLARHLNVRASTMSEAVKKLTGLGLVDRRKSPTDARQVELRLTERGAEALAGGSVLDAGRLAALLALLSPVERKQAIRGLELLGRAARSLPKEAGKEELEP